MKSKISILIYSILLFIGFSVFSQKTKTVKKKTLVSKNKIHSIPSNLKSFPADPISISEEPQIKAAEIMEKGSPMVDEYISLNYTSKYLKEGYKVNYYPDSNKLYKIYSKNGYDGLNGLLDKNDELVLPIIFNEIDEIGIGYYQVTLNYKYGVYDYNQKKWNIPLIYDSVIASENKNYFIVRIGLKYGVVDKFDNEILPLTFNLMSYIPYSDDLIVIGQNSSQGIFSLSSKTLLIPLEYENIDRNSNAKSGYVKVTKDSKENLITFNNKLLFKTWYDGIYGTGNENTFIVKLNGKWGCVDKFESIIHPIDLNEINLDNLNDGSYLAKNSSGKTGSIKFDGEKFKIVLPFIYDNINQINYRTYVAKNNGKLGLIRSLAGSELEVGPCEFDLIEPKSKFVILSKNKKFGVSDFYSKEIISIENDLVKVSDKDYGFTTDYIVVINNKKATLFDKTGNKLSQEYDDVLIENKFIVYKKGTKFGLLSDKGVELTEPIFQEIKDFDGEYIISKSKDKYGIYSIQLKKMVVKDEYDFISISENDKSITGYKNSKFYNIIYSRQDTFQEVEIE